MKVHANAALGPAGRLALVQAIESGMTHKAAAAALWLLVGERRGSDLHRPGREGGSVLFAQSTFLQSGVPWEWSNQGPLRQEWPRVRHRRNCPQLGRGG